MRCSACEKQKEGYLCPGCGYDDSCNYEFFRTFTPVSGRVNSISRHREKSGIVPHQNTAAKSAGLCPVCGFDESLNYESYATFAPANSGSKSLAGHKKDIIPPGKYYELMGMYKQLLHRHEMLMSEMENNTFRRENSLFGNKLFHHQRVKADTYNTSIGINAGDVIKFGSYIHGTCGEKEQIEWLVLTKENDRALLISKYALDCQKYNKYDAFATWETCTLRKWLNEDFYNTAFSITEQSKILITEITADKNPKYDINPGNSTHDKVFLLSCTEAQQYLSSDEAKRCAPTAYAKKQGVLTYDRFKTTDGNATCWWWLRTPGSSGKYACYVNYAGLDDESGDYVYNSRYGIRPALWINL